MPRGKRKRAKDKFYTVQTENTFWYTSRLKNSCLQALVLQREHLIRTESTQYNIQRKPSVLLTKYISDQNTRPDNSNGKNNQINQQKSCYFTKYSKQKIQNILDLVKCKAQENMQMNLENLESVVNGKHEQLIYEIL